MQSSNSVPSPRLSKMERATSQPCFQTASAIFERSSKEVTKFSSKWFIQHVEACMSLCYHLLKLSLAEAKWPPAQQDTSSHIGSTTTVLAAFDCLCIPLSTGADVWPAQLQWPIGADCFGRGRSTSLGETVFSAWKQFIYILPTFIMGTLCL